MWKKSHAFLYISNRQRAKPKWTPIHKCYKGNKIPSNTAYKGCEGPLQGELQTTAQGKQRGYKQMEKLSMLMDRKTQYHENGRTAQSNIQIQCYPHQATTDFLHRIRKHYFKFHMEPKKSPYSQDKSGIMVPDFKLH